MTNNIVFFNGKFITKEMVCISPDDRGFLLADGVYDVIRLYSGKFFLFDAHLERLKKNLLALRIRSNFLTKISEITTELIIKNPGLSKDAKLYLQITRGVAKRTHSFPVDKIEPTIYMELSDLIPPTEKQKNGVSIILISDNRWSRCDLKTIALIPNVLANQQAKAANVEEAVFVRNGKIKEGSHTNVFAVSDHCLITPPLDHYILPGITRNLVIELAEKIKLKVAESPISKRDFLFADEVFLTGTTTEIMPVIKADTRTIGDGRPGKYTRLLQNAFRETIRLMRANN